MNEQELSAFILPDSSLLLQSLTFGCSTSYERTIPRSHCWTRCWRWGWRCPLRHHFLLHLYHLSRHQHRRESVPIFAHGSSIDLFSSTHRALSRSNPVSFVWDYSRLREGTRWRSKDIIYCHDRSCSVTSFNGRRVCLAMRQPNVGTKIRGSRLLIATQPNNSLDRSPNESGCFATSVMRRRLNDNAPLGEF